MYSEKLVEWNKKVRAMNSATLAENAQELHHELKKIVLDHLTDLKEKVHEKMVFLKNYKKEITKLSNVDFLSEKPDFSKVEESEKKLEDFQKQIKEDLTIVRKIKWKPKKSASNIDIKMDFLVEKQRLLLGYDPRTFHHKLEKEYHQLEKDIKKLESHLEYTKHIYKGLGMKPFKLKLLR